MSLADLVARADPRAQRVKEPLLTAVVGELPCLAIWAQATDGSVRALPLWHQETRQGLRAVKLCSTNACLLASYTDELHL